LNKKKAVIYRRLIEGITRGETAIRDGRVLSHDEAKKKLKRWLK